MYKITIENDLDLKIEIEKKMVSFKLKHQWLRQTKSNDNLVIEYEVRGAEINHEAFINHITTNSAIKHFEI